MPHVCGDEPYTPISATMKDAVCPTYVGMNRCIERAFQRLRVCPTYVGMNRLPEDVLRQAASMPHVCGDEP